MIIIVVRCYLRVAVLFTPDTAIAAGIQFTDTGRKRRAVILRSYACTITTRITSQISRLLSGKTGESQTRLPRTVKEEQTQIIISKYVIL